jgi:prophage regulatory protein
MAHKATVLEIQPATLPATGYSRAAQLLPFLPFRKSTLLKWSKEGLFPKPIHLSPTMTAWDNAKVHEWFRAQGAPDQAANDAQHGKG